MIKRIANILGIDIIPRWLLVRLFILATAFGGFHAIMFTSAVSLFIFNNKLSSFPEATALSGLLGVIVYNLYKFLNQEFVYRNVIRLFFLFTVLCLSVAIFLPKISENFSMPFLLYVIWLPVTIIGEQIIIGIGDKIIIIRLQQNLRRFIESGIILGTVVFSIIIAVLSNAGIRVPIFIPSLVLIAAVVIESDYLIKRLELKGQQNEEQVDSIISLFSDLPQKFKMLSLIIFTFISVINFVFIDYSFLNVLSISYSSYEDQVVFLSFFLATIMIINLIFKLFVYQNLIKTFRINNVLYLSSCFLLFILLTLTILIFVPAHSNFYQPTILVFMLVVFGRFFAFLFRESLELNVFRLIISAFSTYGKKLISPTVLNLLNFWACLLSGLILLLIVSFDFQRIYAVMFSNQFFVLCWVFASALLVFNYSGLINKNIEKLSAVTFNRGENQTMSLKDRLLISTNLSGMKYLLNYQRQYQPFDFQKSINEIPDTIQHKLGIVKNEIIGTNMGKTTVSNLPRDAVMGINFYDSDESYKLNDIESLASSYRIKDRIKAVRKIAESGEMKYRDIFKMLLRDNDDEVKRNAFIAVVSYHNSEIIAETIEYINHEEFSTLVSEVLAKLGDNIIVPLQLEFNKTDVDFKIQLQIIKIVSKINSLKSRDFLIDKLVYPNKLIVFEASTALLEQSNIETLYNNSILNQAINKTIGIAAWLIAKDVSIDNISQRDPVKKALFEEYSRTIDLLFILLQLKYNSSVFAHLKKDFINSSSNEQNEFNVELLNQIVDDTGKEQLFPLLHNNQKSVKIEQLQKFFPIQVNKPLESLSEIIVADSSYANIWLKACALKLYIEKSDDPDAMELYAQIFNPNLLIAEIAFFGIYQKYPGKIENLMDRIPPLLKNRIFNVLEFGDLHEYKLIYNKVIALQGISYFNKLAGHLLIPFAEMLEDFKLNKGDSKFLKCSEEEVLPVFFIPYGEISLTDLHKRNTRLNNNNLYGLGLYADGITLNAFSTSVIYFARPEHIGHLVINYEELSDALFKYIQNSNFY
jgi:hypothetical protein